MGKLEGNTERYGDWRRWPWVWRLKGREREQTWLGLIKDWMGIYTMEVSASKESIDVVRGKRVKVFERKLRELGAVLREAKEGGLKVRMTWGDWTDGFSNRVYPRVEVWLVELGVLCWWVCEDKDGGVYWWGIEHRGEEVENVREVNPEVRGKDRGAVVIPGWEDGTGVDKGIQAG